VRKLDFSNTVKEIMKSRGIKGVELARATGYSAAYISELLAGEKRWNEESINRVCEALELKINIETSSDHVEMAEEGGVH
jgi:transcriptional regulator with XRE-family HTH domain